MKSNTDQRDAFCLGFCFYIDSEGVTSLALIRKIFPKWQRGKLNGIGGHVEPGETPKAAMTREFEEEAGAHIETWLNFAILQCPTSIVHCFVCIVPEATWDDVKTAEREVVSKHTFGPKTALNTVAATKYLIPLALHSAQSFNLTLPITFDYTR
jgi:8-oxo-dGTP diphosphatase